MAYLKAISGHGGAGGLMRYLEGDGRAVAHDFLNMSVAMEGRDGDGLPSYPAWDWAAEMDRTRRLAGTDRPWHGRPARTFKHYVVSPDPRDKISMDRLRALATRWAREGFPDHEVAIVYHDDNPNHIPHAHVVVNNVDLATGKRLQDPDPGALNGRLQAIARDMGLSHFEGRMDSAHPDTRAAGSRTNYQRVHVGRAEREAAARGQGSWVADVRHRVDIARAVAADEESFVRALEGLGVTAEVNRRGDWVFSLSDRPSRRVGGTRLGTDYQRRNLVRRLRSPRRVRLPADGAAALEAAAREAISLGGLGDLERLAGAVRAVEASRGRRGAVADGDAKDLAEGLGLFPDGPERPRRAGRWQDRADSPDLEELGGALPPAPLVDRGQRGPGEAR